MKNVLIVCALEKESKLIAEKLNLKSVGNNVLRNGNISLLITGMGKQRTAIKLTEYISKNEKPDIIINIGYAGSTDIPVGKWVNISKVHNYDWDIPGEERYDLPNIGNKSLQLLNNTDIETVECYSAESFVTHTDLQGHIAFDMELHSIALVSEMYEIPALSLKKISDNLSLDAYYDNTENNANVFELDSSLDIIKNYL